MARIDPVRPERAVRHWGVDVQGRVDLGVAVPAENPIARSCRQG